MGWIIIAEFVVALAVENVLAAVLITQLSSLGIFH